MSKSGNKPRLGSEKGEDGLAFANSGRHFLFPSIQSLYDAELWSSLRKNWIPEKSIACLVSWDHVVIASYGQVELRPRQEGKNCYEVPLYIQHKYISPLYSLYGPSSLVIFAMLHLLRMFSAKYSKISGWPANIGWSHICRECMGVLNSITHLSLYTSHSD